MINLQVGDCWLWSLIFQIQRYYSVVIVTQKYCTLIPLALGFGGSALDKRGFRGGAPENFFWDVCWPTVLRTHGIGLTLEFFPWYFPYKREHCKSTGYGIVLYWKRDCESMKRKCSGFAAGCIPSSFRTVIKGLANFFVDVDHRLGEPCYICVSL